MNLVAKVLHATSGGLQNNGGLVIGQLSFGLSVDADKLQVVPHFFQQAVIVPFVVSRNGNAMRNFTNDVQFFDGNLFQNNNH